MVKTQCVIVNEDEADFEDRVWGAIGRTGNIEPVSLVSRNLKRIPSDVRSFIVLMRRASFAQGMQRVRSLRSESPAKPIFVAGESLDAMQLTELIGAGICDFVSVPFDDGELVVRLRRALGTLAPDCGVPDQRPGTDPRVRNCIGTNIVFVRQIAKLPVFAKCDAGVLILGETGTGKEVCAQSIHYLSARNSRPWVAVDCGAISAELIESELFGHVRGAFTSALSAREGLVAEAEGGTLFLDDIDCLSMPAQSKLLRFLQEREYRPVGANAVRHADVRVIAASNRDLLELSLRGLFRRDLYFRLNILPLMLPPLRERRDDIPALALHFIHRYAVKAGRPEPTLSPLATCKLISHDWPGNVRELQHVIERAVLTVERPILTPDDLDVPDALAAGELDDSFSASKARVVQHFERAYIEGLLTEWDGNVTRAARAAKKNRRAFFALIRKHQIEPKHYRTAP